MARLDVVEESPAEHPAPRRRFHLERRHINTGIGLVTLLGVLWLGSFIYERMTNVYVEDARIGSEVIGMASRVPGWITEFHVETTDFVSAGDILVTIDSRDAAMALLELEARLAGIQARRETVEAELAMVSAQTDSSYRAYVSRLASAEAALAAAVSSFQLAESDFARADDLLSRGVISRADWEDERNELQSARQARISAEAEVAGAEADLLEADADRQQITVLQGRINALRFEEEQVSAQVERQAINVEDRTIRSPVDGVIDMTFSNAGEYVLPGQRLLMVHDTNEIWVDCNVKETEIRHLRVGMTAEVTVDAYPGETFYGQIIRVGNAATSEFSLLPNANPSGNFTKITQRLPVRIALDQSQGRLRPGMMVEVKIGIDDGV